MDDCAGLEFPFGRIKIPSGGITASKGPGDSEDDVEMVKEINGVILYNHSAFSYYTEKYTGENNPPDCGSFDGVTGHGNPDGNCGSCPYNQFDWDTPPDEDYRDQDKATLDPAKAHIVDCSFSIKEHTVIYVPVKHIVGLNINNVEFFTFLVAFLSDRRIIKITHNISFEAMFLCHLGTVIVPPVYDTIAATSWQHMQGSVAYIQYCNGW